jgi:hypothetical protein
MIDRVLQPGRYMILDNKIYNDGIYFIYIENKNDYAYSFAVRKTN